MTTLPATIYCDVFSPIRADKVAAMKAKYLSPGSDRVIDLNYHTAIDIAAEKDLDDERWDTANEL